MSQCVTIRRNINVAPYFSMIWNPVMYRAADIHKGKYTDIKIQREISHLSIFHHTGPFFTPIWCDDEEEKEAFKCLYLPPKASFQSIVRVQWWCGVVKVSLQHPGLNFRHTWCPAICLFNLFQKINDIKKNHERKIRNMVAKHIREKFQNWRTLTLLLSSKSIETFKNISNFPYQVIILQLLIFVQQKLCSIVKQRMMVV